MKKFFMLFYFTLMGLAALADDSSSPIVLCKIESENNEANNCIHQENLSVFDDDLKIRTEVASFLGEKAPKIIKYENFWTAYAGFSMHGINGSSKGAFIGGLSWNYKLLKKNVPFFIEMGVEYGHYTIEHKYIAYDVVVSVYSKLPEYIGTTTISKISVPINLTYIFSVGNNHLQIVPFIGQSINMNIADDDDVITTEEIVNNKRIKWRNTNKVNLFTVGLNAGVKFYISNLIIGYRFQQSEMRLYGDFYDHSNSLFLGYRF